MNSQIKPKYILCNCYTVTDVPKKSLRSKCYTNSMKNRLILFKTKCLSCLSLSDHNGEISHKDGCAFEYCIHSDKYCGISPWWEQQNLTHIVGNKILDKAYKKNNISYSKDRLIYEDVIPGVLNMKTKWSSHQPNIRIRQIHIKFRGNLFEKIQEQFIKLDKKRMNLVFKIIEIKTGKNLC